MRLAIIRPKRYHGHKYILLLLYTIFIFGAVRSQEVEKDEDDNVFRQHVSNIVESSSLDTPFNDHMADGTRYVSGWNSGGDAIIKQSFIRLTPDRPFTSGYIWAVNPLGIPEFSFEWKFRVSGQNDKGGGEYLGLWITDRLSPPHSQATLFGMDESFVGFGFIIDTKREAGDAKHRDIRVVHNNGSKGLIELQEEIAGCNMNIKYWEGRDDFSVLKSSRMRAKFHDNRLLVDVDSRNTGRWRRCLTLSDLNLPDNWLQRATVGMLGLNVDDSSNKDILSFRMYKDPNSAWAMEKYEGEDDDPDAEWSLLVHHMEHEMFTVQSTLKTAIYALENAEASAERRISALETRLSSDITRKLDDRLRSLENEVHRSLTRSVHNKVAAAENKMVGRLESTLSGTSNIVGKSWRTPFYILCGIIGAMCLVSHFKYKELRKQHLL